MRGGRGLTGWLLEAREEPRTVIEWRRRDLEFNEVGRPAEEEWTARSCVDEIRGREKEVAAEESRPQGWPSSGEGFAATEVATGNHGRAMATGAARW